MAVLRLVALRLAWALPMLFVVSFFCFLLVSLVPGDPARSVLGPLAPQQQVDALHQQMGLDRPLLHQYVSWLGRSVQGDLGVSVITGAEVGPMLNARLAPTLSLIVLATLTAMLLGVGLGVFSGVRGGPLGRMVDVLSVVGLAVPGFWLALMLVSWFAVRWPLFPVTGYVPVTQSPGDWLGSLVLPVAATSLAAVTAVAKQTRDSMLDTLDRDFVRVMQANGLSRRSIVYRHALRTAAVPVVSLLGVISASLLGTTVLIENIFGLPGLGSGAALAAAQHDIPVLQGAVVYFTLIVIVIGLLVDLCQAWLDPRVRHR
ncbi:ABC transporter permease [Micromonospora echinofusca]|uniref:Peptide/nickel transport system permease protein n=1 Tax=Micromonospora echinofusca TaxID=47858 RepID=A0A1C5GGZ9_MICEH|nr:ABC transporter permease [Micromonospora echinofusca]SCG19038.1 peptide/nickel transport system permease protein [Micromonospora echinofusca]